jgi:hypothetical protein
VTAGAVAKIGAEAQPDMAKTLSELLTEIETKAGAEVLEGIKAEFHNLREEAKANREKGEALAKQVGESFKSLGKRDDETFEAFAQRQKSAVDALKGDSDSKKSELDKLMERLQGVETQLKQSEEQRTAEVKSRKQKEVALGLQSELLKRNAAKDTLGILTAHLQGMAEETDSGLYLNLEGGKKPLAEGVEAFLKANPRFVAEQQHSGSGGGSAAGGSGQPDAGEKYAKGDAVGATNQLVMAARQRAQG